jgi:transposase
MNVPTIGIDLAKSVFQVHGIDKDGKTVIQKRMSRSKLLEFLFNYRLT